MLVAGALTERRNGSDEFVARDDRCLTVALAMFVSPEESDAQIAFQIAGADSDGVDANDDFAGSGSGDVALFETVVLGGVTDDGRAWFWGDRS